MSKEFDEYVADIPEVDLIEKKDVALIKIKIGKNHRKESDWEAIKELLLSHDVLTAEPMRALPELYGVEHVLCENGVLYVFTNIDDCQSHLQKLSRRYGDIGEYFEINSIWFEDVLNIAQEHEMNVVIDKQDMVIGKYMVYDYAKNQLNAVMAGNRN